MKAPRTDKNKYSKRFWLRRILIVLAFIIVIPLGLFTVGWFNRDAIIEVFQEWYETNHNGTLSIGKVHSSLFKDFPKVGITIHDIEQTNFDSISDKESTVFIKKAKLLITAKDILSGNFKFEKIEIEDATIKSRVLPTRPLEYYIRLKIKNQQNKSGGLKLPEWLDEKGIKFGFKNVSYIIRDTTLNKYFNLYIKDINGNYKTTSDGFKGELTLDVIVNALGFNTKKGSYFSGQRVRGSPSFIFSGNKNTIELPEFNLRIDDQNFDLVSVLDLSQNSGYSFFLNNKETDLEVVKNILADSISVKIQNYKFKEPFNSKLSLEGSFGYGNNPKINAEFNTQDNQLIIADKYILDNAKFSGYLTSEIHEQDSLARSKKSPKDLKLYMEELRGNIDSIDVLVEQSYFQSSLEALNYVSANVTLDGSNESLERLVKMDNFDFIGGRFNLDVHINGDIPQPRLLLDKATGSFKLNDTRVVLKKNGLQLPIKNIDLELNEEDAVLKQLRVILPSGDKLDFTGNIKHPTGILHNKTASNTSSNIRFKSNFLNLNNLINTAKEFAPKSNSNVRDRKNLNEIFAAIYTKFNPTFSVDLGSLKYNEIVLQDLRAKVGFTNSETIRLSELRFKYLNAEASLDGKMVVPSPNGEFKDPINLDINLNTQGEIDVFQDIFNIELVDIKSGKFNFEGHIKGNVNRLPELLENAQGNFTLNNTVLYHEQSDLDIELDSLALFIDHSDIHLEKFDLELDTLTPIRLSGILKEFPKFLLADIKKGGSVTLNINAAFMDADRLLSIAQSLKSDEQAKNKLEHKKLYAIFKDINYFKPRINLNIDSINYRDLTTKNLQANAFFENDSTLSLENLEIGYKSTKANIAGSMTVEQNTEVPKGNSPFKFNFTVNVEGKNEDLNDYLKTINFRFNSGDFTFDAAYEGQSADLNIIDASTFGELKLGPSIVLHQPTQSRIPIDSIHLQIENDVATLKKLDIDLPGKSSVDFSGFIDNFSSFIDDSIVAQNHTSKFTIGSNYLDTKDIKEFLNSTEINNGNPEPKEVDINKFKESLRGISSSFNPELILKIDSLKHKDLVLDKVETKILFDGTRTFKIEETNLNFYGGSTHFSASIDLPEREGLPIFMMMNTENINLKLLLEKLDYLNMDALKNAEKIEGVLSHSMEATAELDNDGQLDMNSINGFFTLTLRDLELHNFKPIMDNVVLLKKERFKNLRFQPLQLKFDIVNGEIIIPRTEIQSSAIHVFLEGKLKLEEYVNIWLSVPWKNLKSNDGLNLPEKTTFAGAGSKFYLQLVQDKNHKRKKKRDLKIKFRLGNRKLRNSDKQVQN